MGLTMKGSVTTRFRLLENLLLAIALTVLAGAGSRLIARRMARAARQVQLVGEAG